MEAQHINVNSIFSQLKLISSVTLWETTLHLYQNQTLLHEHKRQVPFFFIWERLIMLFLFIRSVIMTFFFLFFFLNVHVPAPRATYEWLWKDEGQLWFWSSRSLAWVQADPCEGGFATLRRLHLIPELHYTSSPVKEHTDAGTSPSLQRRRGILYCLMHHWGNIMTSTECSEV